MIASTRPGSDSLPGGEQPANAPQSRITRHTHELSLLAAAGSVWLLLRL
jgi:hypothetical protein